jgi:hypothetical protein
MRFVPCETIANSQKEAITKAQKWAIECKDANIFVKKADKIICFVSPAGEVVYKNDPLYFEKMN